MIEAKLTVECPGLINAIENLAAALLDGKAIANILAAGRAKRANEPTPVQPQWAPPPTTPAQFSAQTAPVPPPPQAVPAPAPVAPPLTTQPMPVPTAPAPAYTLDQLMNAGAALASTSPENAQKAMGLLAQFGVQSVTELRSEQVGAFATALRGLGARI